MVLPEKTAIIIIGGGVMGCSIAYRLAKAGQNIVLLESRNIASGASGRNGGMVMQLDGRDFDKDAILNRLTYTRKNNRILENLADELGADLEYTKCGSLDLAWTEKELEYLQKLVKFQKKLGDTEIQLLDRKETKEKCPLITSCALGSRFRSSDGTINPFKLTYGFASRAKKYGAKIFTGVEVKKIVIKDGEVKGVETALGHIKSNWVINATNAWAPNLTGEIDILPLRQVAVVTERVPALAVFPFEAMLDNQVIFGTTQTATGGLIVGGLGTQARKKIDHYCEDVSFAEIQGSASIFTRLFHDLGEVNIIRSWAGTMAFTADGLPCIGPSPGIKGLFIAAGFSNGMAFSAIVGKLVAEYIIDGRNSLPIAPFDPKRFWKRKIKWPGIYNYTILANFLGR